MQLWKVKPRPHIAALALRGSSDNESLSFALSKGSTIYYVCIVVGWVAQKQTIVLISCVSVRIKICVDIIYKRTTLITNQRESRNKMTDDEIPRCTSRTMNVLHRTVCQIL